MRPEYDGVKFYSKEDFGSAWALQKAEPTLASFNADGDYNDINKVLELYNIQQLIETGAALTSWTDEIHKRYCALVKQFEPILGRRFGKIDNSSFVETQESVSIIYLDDFWKLFVKFKVYERISSEVMRGYLNKRETTLYKLLTHKELVGHYDEEFAEVLRISDQTVRILASKFLEKNKSVCYLPKSFKPAEFEEIFLRYVHGDNVNANLLQLIYKSQSSAECPISDSLRLEARRANERFWKDHSADTVSFECGVGVTFQQQDKLKICNREGTKFLVSYDSDWLEETLDYPSILNNFRYVFEMIDLQGRSALASVKSDIGAVEGALMVMGVKFYRHGRSFNVMDTLSKAQMSLYYRFLAAHSINLEDVFKWFFEKYLPEEFGIAGFSMNVSSSTATYIEKCRNLASEMDGVLKQFRMFVLNGSIDRELFEMSSEHVVFESVPSLLTKKYAYAASDDIEKEMFALFSDQALLGYTEKTKSKYATLFQLLSGEEMRESDFEPFQTTSLEWLVQRGSLWIDDAEIVKLSNPRVKILKDLYEHDALCLCWHDSWISQIDHMIELGDLRGKATLFSQPEADYLDYILNKSKFSDGLDLRNKYIHSTYSTNETEQQTDYIQLLKLMVLIITKMNDEFCIWKDNKEVTP